MTCGQVVVASCKDLAKRRMQYSGNWLDG
uniref:Uncharacterized protein n=1 Tax=Vitis vinifera TaxID=29760 RepID=F6I4Z9_VITVI